MKLNNLDRDFVKACFSLALKGPSEVDLCKEIISQYKLIFIDNVGFYEYKNGRWILRSDQVIKSYINNILGNSANYSRTCSIFGTLKSFCISEQKFNTQNIFAFRNGVLDLASGKFIGHSPEFYNTVQASYDYDPHAGCENWINFVNQIMSYNPFKVRKLQEMCGYVLFNDCRLQKAFILQGDGANGKSTFLDILLDVFGRDQCTSLDVSKLGDNFQAVHLKDSILNITDETQTSFKNSEAVFRRVVTGQTLTDSFKGKDIIHFNTRAKLIISENSYISSNDISYAMTRRLEFIKFDETFKDEKADKGLPAKLRKELPGIFNWILSGYNSLMKHAENNEGFTQTVEHEQTCLDFMLAVNPIAAFVHEELSLTQDREISAGDMYRLYKEWCADAGHTPSSRNKMCRSLRKILPQMKPDIKILKSGVLDRYIFPKINE